MQGAIVIDKPAGRTSHDVVARVRKIVGEKRVGHTGTLDPFATGVLVLLIGQTTRLAQFLSDAEKEYEAVIRFGYATDTGDATGARITSPSPPAERGLGGEVAPPCTPPLSPPRLRGGEHSMSFSKEEIEAAMTSLRREISQTPPMYSAKKVGGRKLYELARAGEEVEREPITVTISEFESLNPDDLILEPDGTADLLVRVVSSAGTYIRTLAEDLGKQLGIGAHVTELRRTRAGAFTIENATTLESLDELVQNGSLAQVLITPDQLLSHLPSVKLSDEDAIRTRHGIDLPVAEGDSSNWEEGQAVRLQDTNGNLIAVGKYYQSQQVIHPQVVINCE